MLQVAALDPAHEPDRAARFEQFVAPLWASAFALACAMLRDRHAAEDAVQEAAIKAWRHLDQLGTGPTPRAWFLTIVANQCRDVRRGRWWRVTLLDVLPERTAPDHSERVVAGDELHRAMGRLRPQQRGLLLMHYHLGMNVQEIATVLSLSPGTVKSQLHRARRRLRAALGEPGPEDNR